MEHILTIDLESFVHLDFWWEEDSIERKKKDNGFIVQATHDLLTLLQENNTKATFFVVAEIFDWYPDLIFLLQKEGHNIGFHTYSHRKLDTVETLKSELLNGERFINTFHPRGFRAPQIFFREEYYSFLKHAGFQYSSSIYGNSNAIHNKEGILEIPVWAIGKGRNTDISYPKDFVNTIKNFQLPTGSGLLINILRKRQVGLLGRQRPHQVIFIHPWQTYQLPFSGLEVLAKYSTQPAHLLYYGKVREVLKLLLQNFKFIPIPE